MRVVDLSPNRIAYDSQTDTLFASVGDFDLTCLDHEDEPHEDVFLQYAWPGRELAGVEIWNFSQHFGHLPALVELPGEGLSIRVPDIDPCSAMAAGRK